MTKIILCGCNGKMGSVVAQAVNKNDNCKIVCGVDSFGTNSYAFPTFADFTQVNIEADVIIDFSNPACLDGLLEYALRHKIPAVICTTGYSKEQTDNINKAGEKIAVFHSGNMSLGVNLLIELSKQAAKVLKNDFDIEKAAKDEERIFTLWDELMPKEELNEVY